MSCSVTCSSVGGGTQAAAIAVFTAALAGLGAPAPGVNNLAALLAWWPYEGVGGFNMLAIEDPSAPCGTWNSACVGCYCDAAHGGAALADNLLGYSQYAPIVSALRRDLPLSEWACVAGLVVGLNFWGTGTTSPVTYAFALYVQSFGCASSSPSSSSAPGSSAPVGGYPPITSGKVATIGAITGATILAITWYDHEHPGFITRTRSRVRRTAGGSTALRSPSVVRPSRGA